MPYVESCFGYFIIKMVAPNKTASKLIIKKNGESRGAKLMTKFSINDLLISIPKRKKISSIL